MGNNKQAEFWNGQMGTRWVSVEDYIDRMLEPLSSIAIAQVDAKAGDRVIDIGCGCGTTSLQIAETGAAVWGVDISAQMIARAKEKDKGDRTVAFSVADAATSDYTPDHDCAFSRFGVMFFSEPADAFANIRTSIKPAGRLVFLCWQAPADNPWMALAGQAIQPFLPEDAPRPGPTDPGPFAFADAEYTRDILESAGFSDINIESLKRDIVLGNDVDELMQFQTRVGPLAGLLETADKETGRQAFEAVKNAMLSQMSDGGLSLGAAAWLVTARN